MIFTGNIAQPSVAMQMCKLNQPSLKTDYILQIRESSSMMDYAEWV